MAHPKMTITVSQHFQDFVGQEIESGRYSTASEVVRAGLRLLEDEQKKLEYLRSEIDKGIASYKAGDVVEYNTADDLVSAIKARRARQ